MTDHFFQRPNLLWYILCIGGLVQFAIVTFWPNIMPYEYLGLYGQYTKYLANHHHTSLVWGFWVAIGLHIFEAIIALRLCKKLNIDSATTNRWFIHTLCVGYLSLGKLRKHAAKKR